jgi:hypothetical protein
MATSGHLVSWTGNLIAISSHAPRVKLLRLRLEALLVLLMGMLLA